MLLLALTLSAQAAPAPMYGEWALDYKPALLTGPMLPAADVTRHANVRFLVSHLWDTAGGNDVGLGFSFGLWSRLDLALVHHTSRTEQVIELRGLIVDQDGVRAWGDDRLDEQGRPRRGDPAPLSLVAVAGADIVMDDALSDATGYYTQLVASRSLAGPWLTLGLVPTAVFVPADPDGPLHVALGGSLDFRPANDWGITADLSAGVPGLNGAGLRWGVAMNGYTGGHVMSILVANTLSQAPADVAVFPEGGLESMLAFGFVLTRDFGPR